MLPPLRHLTRNKLESLVALHLDDVHYVNDILQLQILSLNSMLCSHLLNTLFIPLYVYSLAPELEVDSPQVCLQNLATKFTLIDSSCTHSERDMYIQLIDIL